MDTVSRKTRSRIMASIRSRRTAPEMRVHGFLKGLRVPHKMWPRVPGNPDVVIDGIGLALFVNGCFWHGCRRHFMTPKTRSRFWAEKVRRNARVQARSSRALRRLGYGTMTLWEHDLR